METELQDGMIAAIEQLAGAAALLEQAVEKLTAGQAELSASADATLERVVATVETDIAVKLAAAEQRIAELEAKASQEPVGGRKTVAASANLAAKHGASVDGMQAGALDAALVHLSLEQRIAVKAELLRAGMLG